MARICELSCHVAACRVAEKEGVLGGLRWASAHQILGEERSASQEGRSAKELV